MCANVVMLVKDYVKNYRALKGTATDWREPVIGIASAHDSMFSDLKEIISSSHALPSDFISDAQSVVVFFLPFGEDIIKSNAEGAESSKEWDIANIETNHLILDLNKYLHEVITGKGYTSTVLPATYNYDEKLLISDWSHRHVACIAGIGTFGINNMLITEMGCCGRIGSIITNMPLIPTVRHKQENCIYKFNGTCKKCVDRCVAHAISVVNGKPFVDRERCNNQIYNDSIPQYEIGVGDACGKCMCNLPCSQINPGSKYFEKR